MINRLVGRLLKLQNIKTLSRFSTYDDQKNKNKGGKNAFFSKKDKSKEEPNEPPRAQRDESKEAQHKTIKFLKKHQLKMKNLEPQPQKQLRFRKKSLPQNVQQQKPAPFVKPEREQTQEQQIKKSIFFSKSSPSTETVERRIPQPLSLPQLNQYLNSPSPQNAFYQKLSQDLEDILSLFQSKKWKDLDHIIESYSGLASPSIIQKELHTTLINYNAQNYLDWLKSSNNSYENLSNLTLKKIYSQLIKQNNTNQLTHLLQFVLKRFKQQISHDKCPTLLNVQYKSIQAFLGDIQKESPLKGLKEKVDEKIDVVLHILDVQHGFFYAKQISSLQNSKNTQQALSLFKQQNQKHTLDQWFDKLAYLALDRQVSKSKFKILFQQIFINHYSFLNLQHTYASGLFLRIIQNLYYGSHVTSSKLQQIFTDFMNSLSFQENLLKLRNSLVHYKTRTGKVAFPNATNLVECFEKAFEQSNFQKAMFYFVLVLNGNEKKDLYSFMKKRKFLSNFCQHNIHFQSILNDALFSLSPQQIKSGQVIQVIKQSVKASTRVKKDHREDQYLKLQNQLLGEFGANWSQLQLKPQIQNIKTPQELGWNTDLGYQSYYNLLAQQAKKQVNPYRKELLENILKAKLNFRDTQDIQQINSGSKQAKKPRQEQYEQQDQGQGKENDQGQIDFDTILIKADLNEQNRAKIDFQNKLAIQSAIKLKKYELAFTLCEKIIMEPLIQERTRENICLAVKLFILQENRKKPLLSIDDWLDKIQQSVNDLSQQYLRSVYDRFQNFDQLIMNYLPPDDVRFQYWSATLALDRAQDLIKMDISSKLKTMKYQVQYQSSPIQKDTFIKNNPLNWRQKLLEELGVLRPELDLAQPSNVTVVKSDQEYYQKYMEQKIYAQELEQDLELELGLNEQIDNDAVQLQENQVEQTKQIQNQGEIQAAESVAQQQAAEQQPQTVQQTEVAAENIEEGSSQNIQEANTEHIQAANQQIPQQNQQVVNQKNKQQEQQDELKTSQAMEQNQEKILRKIQGHYSNFDNSEPVRIKGYDFTSFLNIAKTKLKPMFEQEYQVQKQFIKHMINLESLAEQSRLQDIHYLEQKLEQYQKNVRNLENIDIFLKYGLWDFDFSSYSLDPQIALERIQQFRELFFKFKTYEGKKGFVLRSSNQIQEVQFKDEKNMNLGLSRNQFLLTNKFNQNLIDNLLQRRIRFFKEAQAVVKLEPLRQVEELMVWGLKHDEPMAIYLGQKIAMLTNQTISHPLASRVGSYLSHRTEIPSERIQKCKQCLKVVGRINRENIYDFNHDYPHITVRKNFNNYLTQRSSELKSSALQFLTRVDPTNNYHDKRQLRQNLKKVDLVV